MIEVNYVILLHKVDYNVDKQTFRYSIDIHVSINTAHLGPFLWPSKKVKKKYVFNVL